MLIVVYTHAADRRSSRHQTEPSQPKKTQGSWNIRQSIPVSRDLAAGRDVVLMVLARDVLAALIAEPEGQAALIALIDFQV